MKRVPLKQSMKRWIPLAIVGTILCGALELSVQQNFRQSANDPQIQLAQDTSLHLASGNALVQPTTVDIAKSLTPFVMVFDATGKIIQSDALLNNHVPIVPQGIFLYTKEHGEDRFTWQPGEGVRIAAVVTSYAGDKQGFVLAGRNIREVELRETQLDMIVITAWFISLIASYCAVYLSELL